MKKENFEIEKDWNETERIENVLKDIIGKQTVINQEDSFPTATELIQRKLAFVLGQGGETSRKPVKGSPLNWRTPTQEESYVWASIVKPKLTTAFIGEF